MSDFLSIMNTLISDGIIPEDSKVISTHNNLIVSSLSSGNVMRIAHIPSIDKRSDPGDIRYSHQLSWLIGEAGSVLRPVNEMVVVSHGCAISEFPFKESVKWHTQNPCDVLSAIDKFGQALPVVAPVLKLRTLDIAGYANARLEYAEESGQLDEHVLRWAREMLDYYKVNHALGELTQLDPSLVHGDLHAGNVVDPLLFIDLDSTAIGPRLYDLASWRVRSQLGDIAPLEQVVECARRKTDWSEDVFRKLVGWKLLSSVTHVLRYGDPRKTLSALSRLSTCGKVLKAPGAWELG
jgi:hypothetical protein